MPKPLSTPKIWAVILVGLLLLMSGSGWVQMLAQGTVDPLQQTQAVTTAAPLTITNLDPATLTVGQAPLLSITGANFTASSTVELVGFSQVAASFVSSTLLHVTLPNNLTVGQYFVKVNDPVGGSAVSSGPLTVVAATSTPTVAPISVNHFEPTQVISGQAAVLSVFGANFTATSAVHLVGVGFLTTTFINSGSLTASLPSDLAGGQYTIEVTDPVGGTARSPSLLTVIGPTAIPPTAAPPPTETLVPTETLIPTPIPGQPSLFVRAFTAKPNIIGPGETTVLTFEVVNQGNYEAQGIAVSLDAGSKFIPANGQAGATLRNIAPAASRTVSLKVIAAADTPAGPNSIPLSINYSDVTGKIYTSKATLSVTVQKVTEMPQVLLVNYVADPNPAEPGKPIHLQVQLKNMGNEAALQVLVKVPAKDGVLLPGNQGDTFSAGTIKAGTTATLDLPLVVMPTANAGFQTQPLVISYMLDDKVQETSNNITVNVTKPAFEDPLLVLASYDTGSDILKPGNQFQLNIVLQNMGKGTANNLVISFGGNDSSPVSNGPQSTNDNTNSSSSSSSQPSDTFAPLNTSGTVLIDSLPTGSKTKVSQAFIVNAKVASGVYSLPISLRYQLANGTTIQSNLWASLIVDSPPQIQITLEDPLPGTMNVGETQSLSIKVVNTGIYTARLSTLDLTADNAQVTDGSESDVGSLDPNGNISIPAAFVPSAEGDVTVTLTLHYSDDLNREQTIVKTYKSVAVNPPPQPTPDAPLPTPDSAQTSSQDFWGRFLFGLLGLGS